MIPFISEGREYRPISLDNRPYDCPLFQWAVEEVTNNTQAPVELVIFSALSAIAIAVQGLFDVRTPIGNVSPTSLMVLVNAVSGERKSTVEKKFFSAIREVEETAEQKYQRDLESWKVEFNIWDTKRRGLAKALERATQQGGKDMDELDGSYKSHLQAIPEQPCRPKFLYEDATPAALFAGLHENLSSAGLVSSEGSGILAGAAFNELAKQNALWSGETVTVDRASTPSYKLVDARLTVSVMVQPSALLKYIEDAGKQARGSGLWARFLICNPISTQGTRFIGYGRSHCWEKTTAFSDRIRELLGIFLKTNGEPGFTRKIINFSDEAGCHWIDLANYIEAQIRPGGVFSGAGDHASKLLENVARVSALLHVFEGFDGDISLYTLCTAIRICEMSSKHFLDLFVPPPQELQDAKMLNEFMDVLREEGYNEIPKNKVRQRAPNQLRNSKRYNVALRMLVLQGDIYTYKDLKGKEIIVLNPGAPRDWSGLRPL